jgi:drug/metabolite transporter (DMT)-like permease
MKMAARYTNDDQIRTTEQRRLSMAGMDSRRAVLWAVLLSVALNSGGQVLFKAARATQPDATVLSLFLRFETWGAFIIYGLSAICWLWVLSRAQLSFAYPMLSLTFPIVVGLSAVLFSESILAMRWAGVGVIVVGVSLLART